MSGGDTSDGRLLRWASLTTATLVTFPVLGALVVGTLAVGTLDRPAGAVVAGLVALPAIAALVARRRVLWLIGALPALRDELRAIAAEDGSGPGGHAAPQATEVRDAADEVDRRLRDRLTVTTLWRLLGWVRGPAAQAGALARRNLGPRAGATVSTTTGVLERLAGLLLLVGLAAWGTLAQVAVAAVLILVTLLG